MNEQPCVYKYSCGYEYCNGSECPEYESKEPGRRFYGERENTLKPCPFCGGKAEVRPQIMWSDASKRYFVACADCGIETPRTFRTEEQVVEAWNRRVENA